MLFTFIPGFFVLCYAVVALAVSLATRLGRKDSVSDMDADYPSVSIVVAVRNEALQIRECLECLLQQDYESGLYEILVVDDDSQDSTADIVNKMSGQDGRIKVLHARNHKGNLFAKTRPLDVGIRASKAQFIATTDADCRPPSSWLKTLVREALKYDKDMVCGCTVVDGPRLTQRIQRLDWLSLKCVAAGLDILGKPLTAMGNNMLFSRNLYLSLGGFEKMGQSVTEDYLFYRSVARANPDRGMITTSPGATNVTIGESSFLDLLNQKKRWLVGGTDSPPFAWILFVIFFAAHFSIVGTLVFEPYLGAALLVVKFAADAAMIRALSAQLKVNVPWILLPAYQLYQLVSAIVLPVALVMTPRVDWKSRQLSLTPHRSAS
ncbi:MAG: glycosyltransferase [Rhodothermales bacterium]|nr:glycosyltransferase [Rhodothermales bacterium]